MEKEREGYYVADVADVKKSVEKNEESAFINRGIFKIDGDVLIPEGMHTTIIAINTHTMDIEKWNEFAIDLHELANKYSAVIISSTQSCKSVKEGE